jgi:hypothetical protein
VHRILLLAAALPLFHCAGPDAAALPGSVQAAPIDMAWQVDPMVFGERFRTTVTGGPANRPIVLVASADVGAPGACPPQIAPDCMGVPAPFVVLAQSSTDANGAHVFDLPVPPTLPFSEVVIQAIALDGSNTYMTPSLVARIYDAPRDAAIPTVRATAGIGEVIRTEGIVTGTTSNGFFLQDPTASSDGGLWVFSGFNAPVPDVGDEVSVIGTFAQYDGSSTAGAPADSLAELVTEGATYVVLSSANTLPAPVSLSPSDWANPVLLENYEAMRVTVGGPLIVTDSLGFGEYSLGDGGTADAIVNDLMFDYETELLGWSIDDTLDAVTGPLNYSFGNYKVEPTGLADMPGHTNAVGWEGAYSGTFFLSFDFFSDIDSCSIPLDFVVDLDRNLTFSGVDCDGAPLTGSGTIGANDLITGQFLFTGFLVDWEGTADGDPGTPTAAITIDTFYDAGLFSLTLQGTALPQ